MRLLHTKEFKLYEYFEKNIPFHAILSHRWEDAEVTFQDMRDGRGPSMKGWAKIQGCCAQAASDGFEYVWIDSCCIDKSSSAELSEAINSMYRWYQEAQVCYAFLSDVPSDNEDLDMLDSAFWRSKWFTRGWTLQELLAPTALIFYDQKWVEIGTKSTLKHLLERITGIKAKHLFDSEKASVAQKMSWAAIRETTRKEDQAYCLMGLFNVNMPPLYGEGGRAFDRLQLEILRTTDDASIFAWFDGQGEGFQGLLADSPRAFLDSGEVESGGKTTELPVFFQMTSRGLQVEGNILLERYDEGTPRRSVSAASNKDPSLTLVPLACNINGESLALQLKPVSNKSTNYYRSSNQTLLAMAEHYRGFAMSTRRESRLHTLYVLHNHINTQSIVSLDRGYSVSVNIQSLRKGGFNILQCLVLGRKSQYGDRHPAKVIGDAVIWPELKIEPEASLLLIFSDGTERLSLQVFPHKSRSGNTASLCLKVAPHRQHQTAESIVRQHTVDTAREETELPDQDRVWEDLKGGRFISASVKNQIHGIKRIYDHVVNPNSKELTYLVDVVIGTTSSGERLDVVADRQRKLLRPPSHADANDRASPAWERTLLRREREKNERRLRETD